MTLEPIDPERALELYLDHRRTEVAAATLKSHRSRLSYLIEWCYDQDIENLNDLTGRDLYEYRIWRRNDGNLNLVSEKTQLATVRVFVRWLESIEAVEPDLFTKVQLPSLADTDDARDHILDNEDAEELLSSLRKYQYASLHHLLVEFAWQTAMRRGAMHSLDVSDYYPKERYLDVVHRQETPLKNQKSGERYIALSVDLCQLLDDWIADKRPDVVDEYGREPLFATEHGRIHPSAIGKVFYCRTRPCDYTDECPHGRDTASCEALPSESASRCPSSISPHAVRRGAITHWLVNDVPMKVVSDRANVGPDVLEKHYDLRNKEEKMEQRRRFMDELA